MATPGEPRRRSTATLAKSIRRWVDSRRLPTAIGTGSSLRWARLFLISPIADLRELAQQATHGAISADAGS